LDYTHRKTALIRKIELWGSLRQWLAFFAILTKRAAPVLYVDAIRAIFMLTLRAAKAINRLILAAG